MRRPYFFLCLLRGVGVVAAVDFFTDRVFSYPVGDRRPWARALWLRLVKFAARLGWAWLEPGGESRCIAIGDFPEGGELGCYAVTFDGAG